MTDAHILGSQSLHPGLSGLLQLLPVASTDIILFPGQPKDAMHTEAKGKPGALAIIWEGNSRP